MASLWETLNKSERRQVVIFVTLGSQKFQFNRLLQEIDKLVRHGIITEELFAQTGYSDYVPRNYRYKNFLNRDEFSEIEAGADIVITHGGTGAIIGAVKKGKKVIAVPRLEKYGEHVDNHQIQLINQFKNMNLICGVGDCSELETALGYVRSHEFSSYKSNTDAIINSIERFLSR